MIIARYMDVDVEYDPEKHLFFAAVNGKKLHHKKQTKLEGLIKKALAPKKKPGRPPKEKPEAAGSGKSAVIKTGAPKRKYTRHGDHIKKGGKDTRGMKGEPQKPSERGAGTGLLDMTPADMIKDMDDIDIAAAILKNKLDKAAAAKNGHKLEAAISIARESVKTATNAVKSIVSTASPGAG